MKILTGKNALLLLVILGAFLSFIPNTKEKAAQSSTLLAGVSKVNITPRTPIRMSGYGGRDEPFKGIHDSLYVTATVFSDGMQKSVIVTADLIGLSHAFCD